MFTLFVCFYARVRLRSFLHLSVLNSNLLFLLSKKAFCQRFPFEGFPPYQANVLLLFARFHPKKMHGILQETHTFCPEFFFFFLFVSYPLTLLLPWSFHAFPCRVFSLTSCTILFLTQGGGILTDSSVKPSASQ